MTVIRLWFLYSKVFDSSVGVNASSLLLVFINQHLGIVFLQNYFINNLFAIANNGTLLGLMYCQRNGYSLHQLEKKR